MNKKYSEYKDSGIEWIGRIPAGWSCKKIRFICRLQKGKNPEELLDEKVSEEYFPYLSMEYLRGNAENLKFCKNNNGVLTDENDLLVLWDGSNAGEIINSKKGILSSTLAKIHDYKNNLRCLKYTLKAFEAILKDMSIGMGIPHVDGDFLKNSSIPIPEIYEQSKIIDFLNNKIIEVDDLVAKKERMIDLLKEERTAIINHAVTKGLDPDVEMKDSGVEWLGEIPAHWEVKRLKFVIEINPQRANQIDEDEQAVFIAMESMNNDGTFDNSVIRPYSEVKTGFTYFAENDVIFAKITPCFENGKGALLSNLGSKIGFGSTEFHVLRSVYKKTMPEYIYFLTISGMFRRLGEAFMQGVAGQKRVTNEFVKNFTTGIPPVDEQEIIAKFLNKKCCQLDQQINREERSIELLKEYRTALISEVVTGKIDVRGE